MILEIGRRRPALSRGLKGYKSAEVETIEVHRVTVRCSGVGLSQDSHEEPLGRDDARHTDVGTCDQAEEIAAAAVNLSHLSGRIVHEVLRAKREEAMIELELRDHEETL